MTPSDSVTPWAARPRIILILIIMLVVGAMLALVGLIAPRFGGDGDESSARNQVTARATDFAVAYNTYDVADLADYQKRMKGLLTTAYDKQFVEITNAVFGALKDKKQKSGDAKVRGVAVDSIDKDSAEAIVAVDAAITNTDNAAAVVRRFRWKISFTNTKGNWLVSNFESVASVEAEATPVPSGPTPTPTQSEAP